MHVIMHINAILTQGLMSSPVTRMHGNVN